MTREDVERAFEQKVAGDETIIADLAEPAYDPRARCSSISMRRISRRVSADRQ